MHRSNLLNRSAGSGAGTPEDLHFPERSLSVPHPLDEFVTDQDRLYHSSTPPASDFTHRRPERPYLGGALNFRTMSTSMSMPEIYRDRLATDSPTHQTYMLPNAPFAALRHGSLEESTSSPRTERLPSFRQLSKIADAGPDGNDNRTTSYPALPAPSNMPSQSPVKSLPYFNTASQQSSPSASFAMLNHPSPTSVRLDLQEAFTLPPSPAPYLIPPDQSRFADRRQSSKSNRPPSFLNHTSSTDTAATTSSYQSSGADSYDTANTTPIEISNLEAANISTSSIPGGMQQSPPASGLFVCNYQGCNAPPFQTQYLLNSHANVHSSNRPHYCPVRGCPRGEGGKGFKRKNEMIRHGLVHDSPGYICPFCPLREHKYPRPDNLQRHVRVHHVDKEKDDPLLREVLAQRPEGGNRGRRRRTGP